METASILVEKSFKEENDKIKMRYLNHDCLWAASRLWSKYKGWYLQEHGEEFPEEVETDESEDEFRVKFEKEEERYLNPSTFTPPIDDPEDSDDGLDVERKVAIEVSQGRSSGDRAMASVIRHMVQSSARSNGGVGEKITDEFVRSFKSAILTQTEASSPNKKKLFNLKIQLLNVKEEIFRIVQV